MKLSSTSFTDGAAIPGRCAFAVMAAVDHIALADNRNPQLSWSDAPAGTRSFVLRCIDPDAPSDPQDVNKEGHSVSAKLPRAEFVHWLMANIPTSVDQIEEGSCSQGVTARGKQQPTGPAGSLQGLNDYSSWFAGDADMEGRYFGYDGPCPPWNDERKHRYVFELLALDCESLQLSPGYGADDLQQALADHVLDHASITGTYSLNPEVARQQTP